MPHYLSFESNENAKSSINLFKTTINPRTPKRNPFNIWTRNKQQRNRTIYLTWLAPNKRKNTKTNYNTYDSEIYLQVICF